MGCLKLPEYTYLWGEDSLIAETNSSGTYLALQDGNKNIVGYVKASDGTSVADYEYSPFGKLIAKSGTMADDFNFKFSSYYTDDETALVYYGYRYYDVDMGRWLNRDPIQEKGGVNLYGAMNNNLVGYIDNLGLYTIKWNRVYDSHGQTPVGFFWFMNSHSWSVEYHKPNKDTFDRAYSKNKYVNGVLVGGDSTGTTKKVTLNSIANGAVFEKDKGKGYFLQWSGEVEHEIEIKADSGDKKCVKIDYSFTGSATVKTTGAPAKQIGYAQIAENDSKDHFSTTEPLSGKYSENACLPIKKRSQLSHEYQTIEGNVNSGNIDVDSSVTFTIKITPATTCKKHPTIPIE